MSFVCNFPLFCIILMMGSGIVTLALKKRAAFVLTCISLLLTLAMSVILTFYVADTGESFHYMMGHFPAPWGNELRIGTLEAFLVSFFILVLLLSTVGGKSFLEEELEDNKIRLFYIFVDFTAGALTAMCYTNDLFTGYVFIEILTIVSCGLMMIRGQGRNYVAAARYMVMSIVGSGLFLISLSLLYSITGHLLIENTAAVLNEYIAAGLYARPMVMIMVFMTVGVGLKSGLFPFHYWMPDSYGAALPSSAAILSGIISKIYIVLLIKIYVRCFGDNYVYQNHMADMLFIMSVGAIIFGSIGAIRQKDIQYMNAWSSAAQMGYIYLGISLGTWAGIAAAILQIIAHSAVKAGIFISSGYLSKACNSVKNLKGAAFKDIWAGVLFTAGALSMVGIPVFAGFGVKYELYLEAFRLLDSRLIYAVIPLVLAASTILNAAYYLKMAAVIWLPGGRDKKSVFRLSKRAAFSKKVVCVVFLLLNLAIGLTFSRLIEFILDGISMFA